MSRDRFDLHTHSTASDGLLPPREVVALAAERGLAGLALTDHDTCAGIAEAQGTAEALGIRCIAGVELSCSSPQSPQVHILGYFIDPEHDALNALFDEMRAQRLERATAIVEKIHALTGLLTMDDVLAQSDGAPPGRPHIARAMIEAELIVDLDEAFTEEWFGPRGRVFVSRAGIPVERAISTIHDAGGVAVYAHPGARGSRESSEAAVRYAAANGLDGIEVDHPSHDGDALQRAVELALEFQLVQTAGSDDHATGREGSRLGCRTVPQRIVDALAARAASRVQG
jgi:predicted metal-dependent phosphoesterase TrpH